MATQTSVNNEFLNNVTVSESTAGTSAALIISNTDNTDTGSDAVLEISTGGASAGDAFIHFDNGVVDVTIGVDNTDSDALVFSNNSTIGTSNIARCTPDGEWTYPLQPGFYAYASSTQNNVTGNGALYTVTIGVEDFDQNGDYNTGTSVFTAPKDGIYFFVGCIDLADADTAYLIRTILYAPTQVAFFSSYRPASSRAAMGTGGFFVELDAADTAHLKCVGYGEGSNRLDVGLSVSYFCGVKVS